MFPTLSNELVVNKIYLLRNFKIMLDRDLAEMYGVSTSYLNKAVNRNIKRFPDDFMFQLNKEEVDNLIFQFGTSSWGGTRKLPFAFTELGVAMLSGILSSDRSIAVNIHIMRTFTSLRKLVRQDDALTTTITEIKTHLTNHDKSIELVFAYIDELTEKKPATRKRIGFRPDEL